MNRRNSISLFFLLFLISYSFGIDLNAVPGPKTEVRLHNGKTVFYIDSKPFAEPAFATYQPTLKYFREMADNIGFKLYIFNFAPASFNGYGGCWEDPNRFDFSGLDEKCHNVMAADPNALMLIRLFVGSPDWWNKKYPDEMCRLDNGKDVFDQPCNPFAEVWKRPYPSIASRKWQQDMAFSIRKALEHINASDYGKNVFGYELGGLGSEEFYYMQVNQEQLADYSRPMLETWRRWLKDKYGSDEKLAQSWNRRGIIIDNAPIPSRQERQDDRAKTFRDPAVKMNVIDFDMFQSIVMADMIDYFAGIVKEATGGKKVVGAYCNYSLEFGNPCFGHLGGQYMLSRCRNIDMLLNSPTWYDRQIGIGADYSRRPMQSAMLYNKISFNDYDGGSWLFPKVSKDWPTLPWFKGYTKEMFAKIGRDQACTQTAEESAWMYQRAASFTLCGSFYQSFFDLHGGYYSHPRMYEALSAIRRMQARSINYDCSSASEILAIYDEPSQACQTYESDWSPGGKPPVRITAAGLRFQSAFVKSGAPFDILYIDDLSRANLGQYKMFFFVNAWNIGDSMREFIKDNLMRQGKTIIWCYAPGYFNDNKASAVFMKDLTGINIVPSSDEALISPLMKLNKAGREFLRAACEPNDFKPMGMEEKVCKIFEVKDASAEALATLADSNAVAIARKNVNGAGVYYCLNSVLSPEFVRAIGKNAGVHFYTRTHDTFYGNKSYIAIHASSAGDRTIKLPARSDVYDAMTERKLWSNVDEFEDSFMFGQTRTYRLASPAK